MLYKLNKRFEVPSVRNPPPTDVATQAVLEKVTSDPSQGRGVGTIAVYTRCSTLPKSGQRHILG
jgi:hypothetical protein